MLNHLACILMIRLCVSTYMKGLFRLCSMIFWVQQSPFNQIRMEFSPDIQFFTVSSPWSSHLQKKGLVHYKFSDRGGVCHLIISCTLYLDLIYFTKSQHSYLRKFPVFIWLIKAVRMHFKSCEIAFWSSNLKNNLEI